MRTYLNLLFLVSLVASNASQALQEFEVTAQTTNCEGETGYTSFYSNKLYKIQEASCPDPSDPSQNLKYVMIQSATLNGSYDAIWVTAEESNSIMSQIKEGRSAKIQRHKEPALRVEINKTNAANARHSFHTRSNRTGPKPETQSADVPQIVIIDPAVNLTRSTPEYFSSNQQRERTIVGKVEAEAGLTSVTVNGQSTHFDENGIFKATVALLGNKTPVEIVAVDKRGARTDYTFHINKEDLPQEHSSAKKQAPNDLVNQFGNYHALIIANTNYNHLDKLVTPKNDAAKLAELLANKFGFQVQTVENASRYALVTALNNARQKLAENDNLLIYYAGHGAYDKKNNRGHWLPVDAEIDSTANWVSTTEVTDIVNSMASKHILLVADACYSGALTRTTEINLDSPQSPEAQAEWLKKMALFSSRHVLMSGGIKPVLDDGGNGHSIFANAFIQVLSQSKGIIDGSKIFERVNQIVKIRAKQLNIQQSPKFAPLLESENELGQFLLVENDRKI